MDTEDLSPLQDAVRFHPEEEVSRLADGLDEEGAIRTLQWITTHTNGGTYGGALGKLQAATLRLVKRVPPYALRAQGRGCTILAWASQHSWEAVAAEAARRMLQEDLEQELKNDDRGEMLCVHYAAAKGLLSVLKVLCQRLGIGVLNMRGRESKCPVHEASAHGRLAVVEYLADVIGEDVLWAAGAAVRGRSYASCPPLHYACSKGHRNVIEYLLAHIPSHEVERRGSSGCIAPMHLLYSGMEEEEVLELMLRIMARMRKKLSHTRMAMLADVAVSRRHWAPAKHLWLQCMHGKESLTLQVSSGKDTAVHQACYQGRGDALLWLQARVTPESLYAPTLTKRTPLHIAAKHYNAELFEALLEMLPEEKLLLKCEVGQTALHVLACNGNPLQLMVAALPAAALYERDQASNTPLHYAVEFCQTEEVEALLDALPPEHRADPDRFGWTPLHQATLKQKLGAVKLLLNSYSAEQVAAADEDGLTARSIMDTRFPPDLKMEWRPYLQPMAKNALS